MFRGAAGLTLPLQLWPGAILNPARLIGPALVFLCGWKRFW